MWRRVGATSVPSVGTVWQRLRELDRRAPWALDAGLAAVLLVGAVAAAAALPGPLPLGWRLALLTAAAVPYLWLRRRPVVTLVAGSLPVVTLLALGEGTAVIGAALFLAAYWVAVRSPDRVTALAAGYCVLVLIAIAVVAPQRFGWGGGPVPTSPSSRAPSGSDGRRARGLRPSGCSPNEWPRPSAPG